MTTWTNDELTRIGQADELQLAVLRGDGTPRARLPIWVVRDGDALYVRSYRGSAGAWYRAAVKHGEGHIRAGGVDKDVTLAEVADVAVNDRVDAAYRAKYGCYGASYLGPMTAARDTTLELVPR
ncbi:DUF2255 family protein [Amycolatopsis sp. cg9]|uniref:DUF2255 family protein n=1 Tax=Amycolatopsis sp. cg9 TaxID=3238801 RepID=UPI00352334B8